MTEQEIISYLKENRKKGVAFAFMPEDVQKWCEEHCDETIFHIFSDTWRTLESTIFCEPQGIYCLSTAYESKPEFKAHYEEFEIKNGFFIVNPIDKDDYDDDSPKVYHWWEWTKFLSDNSTRYNDFGGWVYEKLISNGEKIEVLATSPHFLEDDEEVCSYTLLNHKDKLKPAWPTKILFWRHAE